jgi:hypothetical protein
VSCKLQNLNLQIKTDLSKSLTQRVGTRSGNPALNAFEDFKTMTRKAEKTLSLLSATKLLREKKNPFSNKS